MTAGFGGQGKENRIGKDAKITIDLDNIDIVIKKYRQIQKYKKSFLYEVKTLDNDETIISSLIKESEENPI